MERNEIEQIELASPFLCCPVIYKCQMKRDPKRKKCSVNQVCFHYSPNVHFSFLLTEQHHFSCLQSSIFIQTLFQRNFCFRRNLALFAVSCKLFESELYKVLREQLCPRQRGLTVVSFWHFDLESKNLEYKMNSLEYLLDSFIP